MNGNYGGKKRWSLFKKKEKNYAPVAVRSSLAMSSAIIFSNIIYIPHVFAANPVTDVNKVLKDVQSSDGKFKNDIDGQLYTRIVNAFESVIFLIKTVSYLIVFVYLLQRADTSSVFFYLYSCTLYLSMTMADMSATESTTKPSAKPSAKSSAKSATKWRSNRD